MSHPRDCVAATSVKNSDVLNRNGEDERTYLVFELSWGKCCQMPFISLLKQYCGFFLVCLHGESSGLNLECQTSCISGIKPLDCDVLPLNIAVQLNLVCLLFLGLIYSLLTCS